MAEPIRTLIWSWYGAERKAKINALLALGNALYKLALSPAEKNALLPDCIHCELLNQYFDSDGVFLKACSEEVPQELVLIIRDLTSLLETLPPEEAACFSRSIFGLQNWLKVQELSNRALQLIEWGEISRYEQQLS